MKARKINIIIDSFIIMTENPFFKNFANEYSKSKSHKFGEDLTLLDQMIEGGVEKCLDIATGTGFTALVLSKKCKMVVAIDQTSSMADKASELFRSNNLNNIELRIVNFEDFSSDYEFDVITIRRALHHFKDKDIFFKKANHLTKMNGSLIIADMISPENDSLDIFNALERLRDPTHVGALKENNLKSYLEKYGFKILDSRISIEDLSFSDWLYPVDPSSEIGKKCREFLEDLDEISLHNIGYDPHKGTLHKKRIIVRGKKVKEL